MAEPLSFWQELPGLYGMCAFVLAYALVSYKWIDRGYFYQVLNLTGSVAFGYTGYLHGYYQSVGLEIIWGLIASTAMLKLWHDAKKSQREELAPSTL